MKQTDRFLLAIIAGIVTLVVVALALALTRTPQGYQSDTTPGGVAYNYVLAIKQRDDERAYGYLSPDLAGYYYSCTSQCSVHMFATKEHKERKMYAQWADCGGLLCVLCSFAAHPRIAEHNLQL